MPDVQAHYLVSSFVCSHERGRGGLSMSKLFSIYDLGSTFFSRRSLSPLILALVVASIEKQNDQHSQRKEADGKVSHVAQIRAHEDRE
jgi:hypothetical protein